MKRYFLLLLIFIFSSALANEVTYVEWDRITGGAFLNVTVKVKKRKSATVECRVEHQGRPIGSGMGYVSAGVAVVRISMPYEFQNKSVEFSYFCE